MKNLTLTWLCIISQDLPEFFEDNMETWMTNFHGLLTLDNKLLQTDVSYSFFPSCMTVSLLLCYKILLYHLCVSVSSVDPVGRRGSRSPGAAQVSNMWQRSSLRSEVRWRIPAISPALRHCNLEPFSFYWPRSEIRLGESSDPRLCVSCAWSSLSPS